MKSAIRQAIIISVMTFIFAAVFFTAHPVAAVIKNPIGPDTLQEFLASLLRIFIDIAILIAVLFVIFAGLRMVMARGNPEELNKAKSMLLYTLIGAAIAIGAEVIQQAITTTVKQLE